MGGKYPQITAAVKNMIANLTGMICDGAKPSCALKLTSGVSTAVLSAILAMEQKCVTSVEGIIENDVDQCIRNLTLIGSQGMNETDKIVLDIMDPQALTITLRKWTILYFRNRILQKISESYSNGLLQKSA